MTPEDAPAGPRDLALEGADGNREWQLAELVDSIAAEVDHAEDTLSLKSFARGISFAIKQLSLDLAVTVRRDADGRLLFRTVGADETSATVLKLDFAQILQSQLQGLRKPLDLPADTRDLAALPGIDAAAIARLNAIAIYSVGDLERYTQTPAMLAEVARKTGLPDAELRRWRGLPYLTVAKPASGPPGAAVVLEGGNFGAAPDPNALVLFQGQAATITSWSESRLGVTMPQVTGAGVLFAIVDGQVTNTIAWEATVVDLVVRDLHVDPADPVAGEPLTVVADLVNLGGGASGPFQVQWAVDDRPEPLQLHGTLEPGQAAAESSVRRQFALGAGAHAIRFTADPEHQLPELDRANSTFAVTITVRESLRLVIGDHRPLATLDPLSDQEPGSGDTLGLLFRGLGRLAPDTGALAPDTALSWAVSAGIGGEVATFRLRDDVRFHDGTPLSAEDVAFTYRTAAQRESRWRQPVTEGIAEVRPVDRQTVAFTLRAAFGALPPRLWTLGIVPAARYAADPDGFGGKPIGNGPFAVEAFAPGKEVVLRAFRGFAPRPPRLDRITVAFVPDPAALVDRLDRGELDAAVLPYAQALFDRLQRGGEWTLAAVPAATPRLLHTQSPNLFERAPNAFDTAWNAAAWYVLAAIDVRPPVFAAPVVTGGATVQGSVPLTGPAPVGTVVTLRSAHPAAVFEGGGTELALPVASGARRAPFTLATVPVDRDTAVAISAALAGGVARATTLTVASPRLLLPALDRGTVAVGGTVNGTVRLNGPAPAGGLAVALASSNPAVATVPSSVRVAAGGDRATFAVTTRAPGVATVTASLVGSPSQQTAPLTVQAPYTSYALGRGIGVRQL